MCLDVCKPPKKIMQCPEGHVVCKSCADNPHLKICPQCRSSLLQFTSAPQLLRSCQRFLISHTLFEECSAFVLCISFSGLKYRCRSNEYPNAGTYRIHSLIQQGKFITAVLKSRTTGLYLGKNASRLVNFRRQVLPSRFVYERLNSTVSNFTWWVRVKLAYQFKVSKCLFRRC